MTTNAVTSKTSSQSKSSSASNQASGAALSSAKVNAALSFYRSNASLYPKEVVRQIQSKVGAAADGVIGPKTVNAIGRYQSAQRLTADGIAGPATLTRMFGRDIRAGRSAAPAPQATAAAPKPAASTSATALSKAKVDAALAYYRNNKSLYPSQVAKQIQSKVGVAADGSIGPLTVNAIGRYQAAQKLTVDGIAGAGTLTRMFGKDIRPKSGGSAGTTSTNKPATGGGSGSSGGATESGLRVPSGLNDIIKVFGQPGTNLANFSMRASPGGKYRNVYCHRKVGPILQKVFEDIFKAGHAEHIRTFDGCYNKRRKRGSTGAWSTHAWGIAVDVNASANQMTKKGAPKMVSSGQRVLAPHFERNGFYWGAAFNDAMHFQYCRNY